MLLRFRDFKGIIPRRSPRLLPPEYGQKANNVRLWNGEIRAFSGAIERATPKNGTDAQTIYKWRDAGGSAHWLDWDTDVDVAEGAVADDDQARIFYTGDGDPKKTGQDRALPISAGGPAPADSYKMGVKAPATAPALSKTASGSGDTETRYYVCTFVTDWGEEGAPSPPKEISGVEETGSTVEVDMSGESNPDLAYNITKMRVYRTLTGSAATDFVFVDEFTWDYNTASNNKLNDTKNADDLGEALVTYDYDEPPSDLTGLVRMAGGFLAGFSGRQICFSVPFAPYAWPDTKFYRRTIDYDPVALGALGNMLVAATDGKPYVFYGPQPELMQQDTLDARQACQSKRSLVETPSGVVWASPDGLYVVNRNGQGRLLTHPLYSKTEWKKLTPTSIKATVYDGRYYGWYTDKTLQAIRAIVFDPREPQATLANLTSEAVAVHSDIEDDVLYYAEGGKIYEWDGDQFAPELYVYRTARAPVPKPVNMAYLQLKGDFALKNLIGTFGSLAEYEKARLKVIDRNTLTATELGIEDASALAGASLGDLALAGDDFIDEINSLGTSITARVYGDQKLQATVEVTDQKPYPLPSGDRAQEFAVEVEGRLAVEEILLSTSMADLRQG